jgi:hypothetical protein
VLLDLGTNKQPSEPKFTNTHSGNLHGLLRVLHRSDRWPAPVRPVTPVGPVDRAGQAGGSSSRTTSVPESLSDFSRPWNKNIPKTQPARKENPTQRLAKQLQTDQELTRGIHDPKAHESSSSLEANPTSGIHRSDRSHTPVRPVNPGKLGMNNTHGSTPPNLNSDFLNNTRGSPLGLYGGNLKTKLPLRPKLGYTPTKGTLGNCLHNTIGRMPSDRKLAKTRRKPCDPNACPPLRSL